MKKVLSAMAVSAFVLTAGVALAGGPGKKMDAGCPEECQQQIDDLNSSQAQQNEELGAHSKQLENHEGRITALEEDAYDPWYARVGMRYAWMTQDINSPLGQYNFDADGWGGALAFGREFDQFRAELELAYQDMDLDERTINGLRYEGDGNVLTVMVNGYYSMPVYDAMSVYVMAGLGVAQYAGEMNEEGINVADESDNVFAYKAGVGVSYDFTDAIAGDLGYEYLGVADTDIADSINGHNVVASVRFKF